MLVVVSIVAVPCWDGITYSRRRRHACSAGGEEMKKPAAQQLGALSDLSISQIELCCSWLRAPSMEGRVRLYRRRQCSCARKNR